jgi:hypothetical protein
VLAEAERAGGRIVRPAQSASWGGCFGRFPDGYLWKITAGPEGMPNLGKWEGLPRGSILPRSRQESSAIDFQQSARRRG